MPNPTMPPAYQADADWKVLKWAADANLTLQGNSLVFVGAPPPSAQVSVSLTAIKQLIDRVNAQMGSDWMKADVKVGAHYIKAAGSCPTGENACGAYFHY